MSPVRHDANSSGGKMNKNDLAFFHTLLNSQLQELQNRTNYSVIRNITPGDEFQDVLDVASSDTNQNLLLHIRERESRLISKIKKALQRIEDGTYGICETCGEEIPVNRLKARPVTTQCIQCKMREEALERVSGT
jgi:DnaK suppressor protein